MLLWKTSCPLTQLVFLVATLFPWFSIVWVSWWAWYIGFDFLRILWQFLWCCYCFLFFFAFLSLWPVTCLWLGCLVESPAVFFSVGSLVELEYVQHLIYYRSFQTNWIDLKLHIYRRHIPVIWGFLLFSWIFRVYYEVYSFRVEVAVGDIWVGLSSPLSVGFFCVQLEVAINLGCLFICDEPWYINYSIDGVDTVDNFRRL